MTQKQHDIELSKIIKNYQETRKANEEFMQTEIQLLNIRFLYENKRISEETAVKATANIFLNRKFKFWRCEHCNTTNNGNYCSHCGKKKNQSIEEYIENNNFEQIISEIREIDLISYDRLKEILERWVRYE